MTGEHPPFGELRTLTCPREHVAATWWRVGDPDPWEPVGELRAGAEGGPCPVCGRPLVEVWALIDPPDDWPDARMTENPDTEEDR